MAFHTSPTHRSMNRDPADQLNSFEGRSMPHRRLVTARRSPGISRGPPAFLHTLKIVTPRAHRPTKFFTTRSRLARTRRHSNFTLYPLNSSTNCSPGIAPSKLNLTFVLHLSIPTLLLLLILRVMQRPLGSLRPGFGSPRVRNAIFPLPPGFSCRIS